MLRGFIFEKKERKKEYIYIYIYIIVFLWTVFSDSRLGIEKSSNDFQILTDLRFAIKERKCFNVRFRLTAKNLFCDDFFFGWNFF